MKKKIFIYSSIFFLIDLISKIIVIKYLDKLTIIPNFLTLELVYNDGVAFSLLRGKQLFIILISIIVLIYILKNLVPTIKNKLETLSISLLLGGLLGNLFDRIVYNEVIDFISFKIFKYYFPIFNLADTFICIGVFILVILMIKDGKNENRSK